jgi:hypothetical protein
MRFEHDEDGLSVIHDFHENTDGSTSVNFKPWHRPNAIEDG